MGSRKEVVEFLTSLKTEAGSDVYRDFIDVLTDYKNDFIDVTEACSQMRGVLAPYSSSLTEGAMKFFPMGQTTA
jgi:histone deacetylase complex regulatory component SIN3